MPSAESILDRVRDVFEANGWHHEPVPGLPVVEAGFEAHHGRIIIHVQAYEPLGAISVVSTASVTVPPGTARGKTAELLMRANERLNLGGFELRWDAGEVLFRIGNVFPGGKLDARIVTMMVEVAIVEMDRLVPCISLIRSASAARLLLLEPVELLEREDWIPGTGGEGSGP